MKQIHLIQRQRATGPRYYIVTKLVNDAQYAIGESLGIAEVKDLCERPTIWCVTITTDSNRHAGKFNLENYK